MTEQAAFVLFFGLFWAQVMASSTRYMLFDTHSLLRGRAWNRAIPRLSVGIALMIVGPIAILVGGYILLEDRASPIGLARGATLALTVFGLQRLAHAVVLTAYWTTFYSETERRHVLDQWGRDDHGTVASHLLGSVLYLVVPVLVAAFVMRS